jgi:transketolase
MSLDDLQRLARQVRRDILNMTTAANSGHPGGSLSSVEIITALYANLLRHDPKNPKWPDRDRFIMSKGHACPVLYSVLARLGYFSTEEFSRFRQIDSLLQGHAHTSIPGVEMSAGSLGMGLSFGIGTALAARLDGRASRTYVLLGDGECQEGQVWEAAMSAGFYRVDNLTAIVDRNGIQNDRFVSQVMEVDPLADKWRAFGWQVFEVDGHSHAAMLDAYQQAQAVRGRPAVIIARTVKGKGVSFMENNPDFHGKAASRDELAKALEEIGEG